MATPTKARSTTSAGAATSKAAARTSVGAAQSANAAPRGAISSAKALTPASAAKGKTTPPTPAPAGNFLSRLFAMPSAAGTNGAAGTRPQQPGMGRFFFGMMVYLLAAQVMQIVLVYLDAAYWHKTLETTVLTTVPVIGKVTPLAIIFVVILIGLLWALYHFNILPRNMMSSQRAREAAARQASTGKSAVNARSAVNAKAANGAKNNGTAAKSAASAKSVAAPAAKPARTTAGTAKASEPESAGANDDLYDRIKSQQRAQARKQRRK